MSVHFKLNMSGHKINHFLLLYKPNCPTLDIMVVKTRFADIAQHLREAIRTGHFELGCVLPTELELCAHYKTSRHTIRAALQELQLQGLVSRRKNAGTRVVSKTSLPGFKQSLASIEDLVQFGEQYSRIEQQLVRIATDTKLSVLLRCTKGKAWLRITSIRLDNQLSLNRKSPGKPIALTEIYVAPRHEGLERLIHESPNILVSRQLEMHFGEHITEITQDICAVPLPELVAKRLGVEPNAPGLRILRHYLNQDGQAVEISVTHHPAELFSLRSRLERAGATDKTY
jgi:GntR family transcriptional regulator